MTHLSATAASRARLVRFLVLLPVIALIALAAVVLPASAASVQPVVVAGNPNCSTIGSVAEFEVKLDPANPGSYSVSGPGGVTISGTISSNDRVASFSISGGRMVDVIVKGGPNANVYSYDPPVTEDSGLTAPHRSGTSGPTHGISHISFCYTNKFLLAGTKFHDRDADGERTASFEGGLSGWEIEVYDNDQNLVASTTTGSEGDYSFLLVAGQYSVCEVPQGGWIQTTPDPSDACHEVDLQADSTGHDFGNARVITLVCGGDPVTFGDVGNPQVEAQLPEQDGCEPGQAFQFIAETWIDGDTQFALLERLNKGSGPKLVVLETITWVETTDQTKAQHFAGGAPTPDTFCKVNDPFDSGGNLLPPDDVLRDADDISCLLDTSQGGGESRVDFFYSFDPKRLIN